MNAQDWIPMSEEKPTGGREARVLVYTPDDNLNMCYREMPLFLVRTCTDATHWLRLTPPSSGL